MATDNEYIKVLMVYRNVVDTLLGMSQSLCYWTKGNCYANFRISAFKTILGQKGGGENYRYYLNFFRAFSWIVCSEEKFSNPQRIKGDLIRVITVDYEKYVLVKRLMDEGNYSMFLDRFIAVAEQLLKHDEKIEKRICLPAKEGQVLNVKSSDYRLLLKDKCNSRQEYQTTLEVFRAMGWIVCTQGNYTNVQWIGGKSMRVISIDFVKYKLMKELMSK